LCHRSSHRWSLYTSGIPHLQRIETYFGGRDVARVALARFVSRTGGEAAFFVGIWGKAAYEFDADAWQVALLMACMGIFNLVGSSAAGVLVDRFDPRKVLILGEVVLVPTTLSLVIADSFTQLVIFAIPAEIATSTALTAVGSFPPI
jgi:MFS transporter, DHA3 family, macrolide efflux protein